MQYLDEKHIFSALSILKPDNQLFEIRIHYGDKRVLSGYFNDVRTAIDQLKKTDLRNCNVYFTLNEINEACFDRPQKNVIKKSSTTTSDNNIVGIDWLMIDLDPNRPKDTSSSNEQFEEAKILGNKVYDFMKKQGFEEPLLAHSGNGVHLLYKVNLVSNENTKEILKKCLSTLDMLFSYGEKEKNGVGVDKSTFNQSRICKLYGTLAQKGSNSEERPHRMSRIISCPRNIKATDISYCEKLANMFGNEAEKPSVKNHYVDYKNFDIEEWMDKHCIRYSASNESEYTKYVLDNCPFDSNHKGKDAVIIRSRNGAIGFHCFHNSCAGKTWQDVRVLYEPDAYEKKYKEQEQKMYKTFNRDKVRESKPIVEKNDTPVFYTPIDIFNMPQVEETFIKTGVTDIDRKIRGLKKGFTSLWSGLRGSSKSTILSEIALNAVEEGNNVGFFSGELSPKNFMRWMNLQAAGKSQVKEGQYEGYYYVPKDTQKKIAEWLGTNFWLYNNEYGNDSKAILELLEKTIQEKKLDLLILDNLMAFDLSTMNENKWDAQKDFIWEIHKMAQKHEVHIALVAHPRKAMGFLRLDDISGSADLSNAVEYAFIVHRNNNDFKRLTKQMFGWNESNSIYEGTNIVEICKDRDGGTQDYFISLFYEYETKRLKNSSTENIIYGWNKDEDGFTSIDGMELKF